MIDIDSYAYSNNLKTVHPAEKSLFAMISMVACLTATTVFTPLIVLALMAGGIVLKAEHTRSNFCQTNDCSSFVSLDRRFNDCFFSLD